MPQRCCFPCWIMEKHPQCLSRGWEPRCASAKLWMKISSYSFQLGEQAFKPDLGFFCFKPTHKAPRERAEQNMSCEDSDGAPHVQAGGAISLPAHQAGHAPVNTGHQLPLLGYTPAPLLEQAERPSVASKHFQESPSCRTAHPPAWEQRWERRAGVLPQRH